MKESLRWTCTLRFVYIYIEYAHIFDIFVDFLSMWKSSFKCWIQRECWC